jgi:hypothetical protein
LKGVPERATDTEDRGYARRAFSAPHVQEKRRTQHTILLGIHVTRKWCKVRHMRMTEHRTFPPPIKGGPRAPCHHPPPNAGKGTYACISHGVYDISTSQWHEKYSIEGKTQYLSPADYVSGHRSVSSGHLNALTRSLPHTKQNPSRLGASFTRHGYVFL